MNVILITLLTAALFYLGSRAKITAPLWSRYPRELASFMDCAACTGFWWGVICTSFASAFELHFSYLGIPVGNGESPLARVVTPVVVGLCSIVLTPIAAGLMQRGLDTLGTAVEPAQPEPDWQELP